MSDPNTRFKQIIAMIDDANSRDPHMIDVDGAQIPAELVYGRRMTAIQSAIAPEVSDLLRIAVRGQHIERWMVPRNTYPEGRAGYLKWRADQRIRQAGRLGELMRQCGYGDDEIARVGTLIRKERLKSDPDVQMLEDIICVTFLKYYLPGFEPKVDADKLADILAKTWRRMSDFGHRHALALDLPQHVTDLLHRGLARLGS